MKKRSFRIQTLIIVILLATFMFNSAFAELIQKGEIWQINAQTASVTGSGAKSSAYGSLSTNYYGYRLGGGVRAQWLQNTNAFSGTVKVQLFRQTSPNTPISQHSNNANFTAQSAAYQYPNSPYYLAGYTNNEIDVLSAYNYQYRAVSTNIPSTVKMNYLCFLFR